MTKTTHHKLILWLPLLFMAFYTSFQINKIHTTAQTNYNSMSIGVSATHSTSPDKAKDNGIKPNIGLPQDVDKQSITHTAINENTTINITDKPNQTEDTTKISTDTENASFTMTEINTEVLDIRADISQQVSKDGFKAVGDLAMELAANGDESWEDGGISKTLAHAAMGAVVAGIGNGDAIGGALGAGAAEMARPATEGESDATQQWVSTLVGAVAGGGTGASVALDGEKFNRQLHQAEITWIKDHVDEYMALYPNLSRDEATAALTNQALRGVDAIWSAALGDTDTNAQAFINENTEGDTELFQASQSDFYNPTINADIAKQHPEIYAQAQIKGQEILSDPAKLRGALIEKLGVDAIINSMEAIQGEIENGEALYQISKDLADGKITKIEAAKRVLEQGEDILEGAIHSAVAVGKGLYGQATTSSGDLESIYGNGAGATVEDLTWVAIGAAVAVNGRRGGGKSGTKIPKTDINNPQSFNRKSADEIGKDLESQGFKPKDKGSYPGDSDVTEYVKVDEQGNTVKVTVNSGGGLHTGGQKSDSPVYVKIDKPHIPIEKVIVDKEKYKIPNNKKKLTEEDRSVNVIDGETGKPIAPKKTSYQDMHDDPHVPFELKDNTDDTKIIVSTEK